MENLVVARFDNIPDASGALIRLNELDKTGDITIYHIAMIHKTAEGKFELLQHGGPDKRVKVADGAVVGSLVGVLGGPIGLIIGMLTGMMIGSTANSIAVYDFSDEFLNEVNRKISIGTLAIVMDVQEDVEFMIDRNLEAFHGSTIRNNISNQYDQLEDKKWKDLGKEITNEKQELAKALGRDKTPIRKKIDLLKKQREERRNNRETAIADWKNQLHDKIELLDQKIKSSNGKVREKLSTHRDHFMLKLEKFNSFAEDRMF